jgi:hypothetical protein
VTTKHGSNRTQQQQQQQGQMQTTATLLQCQSVLKPSHQQPPWGQVPLALLLLLLLLVVKHRRGVLHPGERGQEGVSCALGKQELPLLQLGVGVAGSAVAEGSVVVVVGSVGVGGLGAGPGRVGSAGLTS